MGWREQFYGGIFILSLSDQTKFYVGIFILSLSDQTVFSGTDSTLMVVSRARVPRAHQEAWEAISLTDVTFRLPHNLHWDATDGACPSSLHYCKPKEEALRSSLQRPVS